MADDSLFLIDIDKILREKAPKKSKYIPKFVVSYLKHIVHQEELNVFLRESKDKVGVDFLKACLEFLDANIVVKGEENLPKEGLYTFVSNHPLGGQAEAHRNGGVYLPHLPLVQGEIYGQRPADEPARTGTALHPHQQDGKAGQRLPENGGGGICFGQSAHHVSRRSLFT